MKQCTKCKLTKENNKFRITNKTLNKYDSWCVDCRKDYMAKNRNSYKMKHNKKAKEYNYNWRRKNPDNQKWCMIKYLYNLSKEDYLKMKKEQNNCCKICKKSPGKKSLCIDHDHKTGKVRGLLCSYCNLAVGTYERMHTLCAKYLSENQLA
jgi:hypothetical protein